MQEKNEFKTYFLYIHYISTSIMFSKFYIYLEKTYFPAVMQCAAVTTQSGAIKDPPQLNDFELPLRRATYQSKD